MTVALKDLGAGIERVDFARSPKHPDASTARALQVTAAKLRKQPDPVAELHLAGLLCGLGPFRYPAVTHGGTQPGTITESVYIISPEHHAATFWSRGQIEDFAVGIDAE